MFSLLRRNCLKVMCHPFHARTFKVGAHLCRLAPWPIHFVLHHREQAHVRARGAGDRFCVGKRCLRLEKFGVRAVLPDTGFGTARQTSDPVSPTIAMNTW